MKLNAWITGAIAACLGGSALAQQPLTEVTFGTNWIAQGEHGGYYQAVADGTYETYGLKVTIVPGGPRASNRMLMTVGKLDFYMGGSMIQAFSAVEKDIPTIVVAAHFQKEPQVLLSHPGQGLDTFADLKKSNDILLSKDGVATFFQWMKVEYGFKDEQVKPYGFNPAPFIANKASVQQGYVTSEPLTIEKAAGFRPNVFLLADHGFSTYSTTVETRREVVERNPDLVQRFVDASTIGWYRYLYGDNTKAKELIKRDNPEMTEELLAYSRTKMKKYGIVDSGDTASLGIGAMTDARMKDFFDKMVKAGLFKADLDYRQAYTLRFVNKGVGLNLKQ
ncbi:ABC transporter substrate-binding protein [Microvirga tunisiensis]|uniref:ABC transporter substrate-binding protein n=1 Tax=Microvirga tunisiensis TaxID=2108360 RepID=A0A5N7MED8_9HYPH|nr:ABC transporter substrate-binding protein [Microvirga tunisiensis]MPR06853.1 ABC transporter substrate-binding protein [Microvirga tunisiensis]MPR25020.1 ABC transporter substrate-binding protein [Microvirga tunisiensis]